MYAVGVSQRVRRCVRDGYELDHEGRAVSFRPMCTGGRLIIVEIIRSFLSIGSSIWLHCPSTLSGLKHANYCSHLVRRQLPCVKPRSNFLVTIREVVSTTICRAWGMSKSQRGCGNIYPTRTRVEARQGALYEIASHSPLVTRVVGGERKNMHR